MKLGFAAMLLMSVVGCQQAQPPKVASPFVLPRINNVDCRDESTQIDIHLADSTTITDCFGVIDAMDKQFNHSSHLTASGFCAHFQQEADTFNHSHPKDQAGYGCNSFSIESKSHELPKASK
jgi:hypothetical protein